MIAFAVIMASLAVIVVASLHHVRVTERELMKASQPMLPSKQPTEEQIQRVARLTNQLYSAHPGASDAIKRQCFLKACEIVGVEPW